ncbi:lipopolysaccharide-responsive and beige-like anchor protein isoform X2 [Bolinopsis microptera]
MRDLDLYMKESEQQALQVLFYLSVLTVTQYHEIVNRHRGGNNITEQVQRALAHVGPLLNDLLLDFQGFFAKTILGTHGRELFNESLSCFKGEVSVVELAMQLCSQEWLTALEKHAGVSFTKLLREGRHVASSTDEYLVKLALWSENVAAEAIAEHIVRAAEFEMSSKQIVSALLAEQHNTIRLLHSQQKQSLVTGEKGWEYVKQFSEQLNLDTEHVTHYRLDSWEDSSRRRYKMLYNPTGTTHPQAVMHPTVRVPANREIECGSPNHVIVAQQLKKSQQPPEDDEEQDTAVDENDIDNNKGNLLFSERATLLLPGRRLTGTLTITKLAAMFSASESREEENYKFYNVDVSAVFTRRYLHLYRALEVFTIGHRSWLFVLTDYEAVRRAVASLPRVGVGLQYGLPSRRQISLAHPRRLLRESNIMDKWRSREISNFDYLMFLNTIAGRSYNDLGQYPIMPWILKNYTSEKLDLSDPGNYRDLSRTMGAQTAERAAKFRDKFEMSKEGVAPPFHYGTHYSTPGFVLMWLLRVEPYTTMFLKLQSGKFDHPCRAFSSVAQAWDNCQRDMADVKELIPEMFYLSELFVNDNGYELGDDEEGNSVNTVTLPPWAKDHHHFLQVHREALESEYVSSNLHKWIDLIFGISQRGDQAQAAINSFYYTTYEGLCDPSQVDDPIIKEALEEQIRSFGQTPPQLLTTPHPARNSIQHVLNANIKNLNGIVSVLNPVKDHPVTLVKPLLNPSLHSSPVLFTVSANQTITTNKFVPSIQNAYQVFVESDPSPRHVKDPMDPTLSSLPSSYAVSPDGKVLFCAGFWDSSFKSFAVDTGKQVQAMFGHRDLVTCISITDVAISLHVPHTRLADGIIVTGSRDATVCVWDWSGKIQRVTGIDGKHASARSVLTGHVGQVECVHVSGEQGTVVSASRTSPILLHRVTGELIRKIKVPPQFMIPSSILITKRCEIVAHYADQSGYLAVFSANGHIMITQELQEQVLSMICDREGNFLITGGFNLTPVVRSIKTLSPVLRLAPCQSAVRVLSLSQDQRFLIAGLTNGTINIYPVDLRRIVGDNYATAGNQ